MNHNATKGMPAVAEFLSDPAGGVGDLDLRVRKQLRELCAIQYFQFSWPPAIT
jgi:hypothetical protein